jgi:DNA (cytosine-5)-methyltransferase 1
LNELALFAGVGGGILGTHRLGIRTVCAVERNEHCRMVLMRRQNEGHLPPFPIWDDVCTFAGNRWRGTVDLVSGGFPCQAFSSAARGRNNALDLWPEMRRVVSEIEPTYVFAENVTLAAIERASNDLAKMGYKAEMLALSAADLGADHIRKRYWLLAYADDKSELQRKINAEMAKCPEFFEGIWQATPGEPRMVDGMAGRLERHTAIGNGQVPIVAASAMWSLANFDG